MKSQLTVSVWSIAIVATLALTAVAHACPMCAEALDNTTGQAGGSLAGGFYYSILFMLSLPFSIITFFGVMFYRLHRKSLLEAGELPGADPIESPSSST
ncbi:hypothetical protein Pan216_08760 [Planctomycetes bacterium Pan216]|uniref:Uncharacterized protein n=1 Tax=Kolteria novifilia TaxID=2527975 RepID=A0A518AZ98_9BACT|nr:hypothetical protein Pan216_08760 [Planctomycetes bacterium Pan216]